MLRRGYILSSFYDILFLVQVLALSLFGKGKKSGVKLVAQPQEKLSARRPGLRGMVWAWLAEAGDDRPCSDRLLASCWELLL